MRFENYQPTKNLQADALIDLQTVDPTDIFEILSEAIRLKVAAKVGEVNNTLQNKKIVLITNQKLGLAQLTFRLSVVGLGAEPITVQLGGCSPRRRRRCAFCHRRPWWSLLRHHWRCAYCPSDLQWSS